MNNLGIKTCFEFHYLDTPVEKNPFRNAAEESGHTWEGWRLPAVPVEGQTFYFSTIPEGKKQEWKVSYVRWVYGEAREIPDDQCWHIEVGLR